MTIFLLCFPFSVSPNKTFPPAKSPFSTTHPSLSYSQVQHPLNPLSSPSRRRSRRSRRDHGSGRRRRGRRLRGDGDLRGGAAELHVVEGPPVVGGVGAGREAEPDDADDAAEVDVLLAEAAERHADRLDVARQPVQRVVRAGVVLVVAVRLRLQLDRHRGRGRPAHREPERREPLRCRVDAGEFLVLRLGGCLLMCCSLCLMMRFLLSV